MCDTKSCKRCKQDLPLEFYSQTWNKERKKYYAHSYCKQCKQDVNREMRYGVSSEEFAKQLARQNNQCMICGKQHGTSPRNFHVDHCHATGRLRGILCHGCNLALGLVKDNTEVLKRMIQYLQIQ